MAQQHSTLYKRTKTGAIQYWDIMVENGIDCPAIIKESGQLGTSKPTLHREPISKGKNLGRSNETSPLEQANLQAKSDWTAKHDEGYKSLEDLGITKITDVSGITLVDTLNRLLPEFNTGAGGVPMPMLANPVDWKKVTYPCFVQPKLDGVRCLMVVNCEVQGDGQQWQTVTFLSRKGKEFTTLAHIASDVQNFLIGQDKSIGFILDGEIYADDLTFQEIVSAVKKLRPDTLKLKFRAYDILNSTLQKDRFDEAIMLVRSINSPHITLVPNYTMRDKDAIMSYHADAVVQGYEGVMIRLLDGVYGQGQRSSHLLKVKEFNTTEFEFSHWETGQREEDLIAVCYGDNGTFGAKMVGTKAEKEELKLHDTGHMTIKHFGYTDDGSPRFPIGVGFRDYE